VAPCEIAVVDDGAVARVLADDVAERGAAAALVEDAFVAAGAGVRAEGLGCCIPGKVRLNASASAQLKFHDNVRATGCERDDPE
jgi:hypothetical protein